MVTKNKTVSIYPVESLLKQLEKFQKNRNLKSLNLAVISILTEYFTDALPSNVPTLPSTLLSTLPTELIRLEAAIKTLDARLQKIENDRPTESLNLTDILESTLPKRVVDIEADSKPPVQEETKPDNTDAVQWLTCTEAFDVAKQHGCTRSDEGFKAIQRTKAAIETYASYGLIFDPERDRDLPKYAQKRKWKSSDDSGFPSQPPYEKSQRPGVGSDPLRD